MLQPSLFTSSLSQTTTLERCPAASLQFELEPSRFQALVVFEALMVETTLLAVVEE
jgi:hypothetical protein